MEIIVVLKFETTNTNLFEAEKKDIEKKIDTYFSDVFQSNQMFVADHQPLKNEFGVDVFESGFKNVEDAIV